MKLSRVWGAGIGLAIVVVAGCSGSTASSTSPDQACQDFTAAYCEKLQQCVPAFVQVAFGDAATCKSRTLSGCTATFSAPKTGSTPDRLEACTTEAKNLSCTDVFSANTPADCKPATGGVANGGACGDDAQCQSAFCAVPGDQTCGSCAVPPVEGGACANDKCPSGLDCVNNVCIKRGKSGDSCSATKPCQIDLVCANGTCATGGQAGAACDPTGQTGTPCGLSFGFICNFKSKQCESVKFGVAGDGCGLDTTTGSFGVCSGAFYCKKDKPTDAKGTCVARAQDGAGCSTDETKGPPCLSPAKCVGGVCKLPDASLCK